MTIDESHTSERKFDLDGTIGACILPFGAGQASFSNESQQDISVLDYEGYINKYSGTKFYMGRGKCDCILESESVATVVLNEITSSVSGMGNLTLPIFSKKGNHIPVVNLRKPNISCWYLCRLCWMFPILQPILPSRQKGYVFVLTNCTHQKSSP